MPKFPCSIKGKDIDYQINYIKSTTNEDVLEQTESGTKVCLEAKSGYCFEHENCPLRSKAR